MKWLIGRIGANMDGWAWRRVKATHLGDNLELLALAELRLGDGLLDALDSLAVELL
jgi:hypothetical protein